MTTHTLDTVYTSQCSSTCTLNNVPAHKLVHTWWQKHNTQMYTEHLVHTLMTTALPYRDSLRYISPSKLPALPRERLPQYLLQHFHQMSLSLPIMRGKKSGETFSIQTDWIGSAIWVCYLANEFPGCAWAREGRFSNLDVHYGANQLVGGSLSLSWFNDAPTSIHG